MIPVLLILIPIVAGLTAFFIKDGKAVRAWSLFASVVTLAVSLLGLTILDDPKYLQHTSPWMGMLGSSFSVKLDGLGQLLCLLTSLSYPLIFVGTWNSTYRKANSFFGWMLLGQAGMMGVFLAMDALLFYFFWELALIPMYFLCSQWGGERRIRVTFKFFIYTFLGSVLMLIGILYLQSLTPDKSFSIQSFYALQPEAKTQNWVFWLFLVAFAIKMPIFPFHTWQPDTYEQAPTATTMVLSGVMVKMGLLGVLRWLLPVLPIASNRLGDNVMILSLVGIIYASLIAIRQDDIKRLVAYSSIAHIGLMCATIFAETQIGMQGVMIQMFNHGINIIGLWILVEFIERQFGTRRISDLGGLAQRAPATATLFVIVALANIALPLTNAFVGEFMMFNGIFGSLVYKGYTFFGSYMITAKAIAIIYTTLAGLGIILAAVYTLNMIRKVFYGESNNLTAQAIDIGISTKLALGVIVILIFWMGVYPQTMLNLTEGISQTILNKADVSHFFRKQ
jgi:NADH-quinone oxidoreductase subunit M